MPSSMRFALFGAGLIAITYGGSAPVIEPFNGGAVSVEMNAPAPIALLKVIKTVQPVSTTTSAT